MKELNKSIKAQEKAGRKADKKAKKEAKKQNTAAGVPSESQPGGMRGYNAPTETTVEAEKQSFIPVIGNEMFKHGFGSDAREYTNNVNEARNNSYNR